MCGRTPLAKSTGHGDWEELIPWLLHQSLGEALVLWWGSAFRAISEVSRKAAEGRSQISLGDDRG